MRLFGTALILLGVAVIWLLGIEGLQPQDAVNQIGAVFQAGKAT